MALSKDGAGQFLELEGTFEFPVSPAWRKPRLEKECKSVLQFFSSHGQENEAQLNPKNCHSEKGPIRLFDRSDAISSKHFKICPSILPYIISWSLGL